MVYAYKIIEKGILTENNKKKYIDVKSNINIYITNPSIILNLTFEKNKLFFSELMSLKAFKINDLKNLKLNLNLKVKSETDFLRSVYLSDEYLNLNHIERLTLNQYENKFKVFGSENSLLRVLKIEPKNNHYKRLLWVYMNYENKFKLIENLKSDLETLNNHIKEFNQYFFDLDLRLNPLKSESTILNLKDIENLNKGKFTNKAREVLFYYYTQLKKVKGKQSKIFKNISRFEFENGLINDNDLNLLFENNLKKYGYETNLKNLNLRFENLKEKVKRYI